MTSRSAPAFDPGPLAAFLRPRLPGADGPLTVERIAGGQSNPTYWLKYPDHTFVLRKQPPGPLLPSAHDMAREYRILSALAGTDVPVPRALLFSGDRALIGTPFYVMAAVPGRVFADAALPGRPPAERAAIYTAMSATLARLHRVDWRALGLGDFGRAGQYFSRQVARWTKQWQASRTRPLPEIDHLAAWLPAHLPPDDETTLAHGDYRLGNLIFHPTEPRVVAVVDWELSTLGHPLADLAYNCLIYHATPEEYGGLLGLDLAALGIPDQAALVADYCRRAGRPNDLHPFHFIFALFRFAVILEGVAARAAQGNASAADAAEVGRLSGNFARRAWALAEGR
ncbi:MAG: phosphotransferase family protein [Anaerolineales bacterium]|nr:phosphotransferase family protein [Anaerolineales bacterium]